MANIINIETDPPTGLVDVSPYFIYIETLDTQSNIMNPGYLNGLNIRDEITKEQIALVSTSDMPSAVYNINIDPITKVITLTLQGGGSGDVSFLAPVLPNRIAVFTDTVGTIGDPIGSTIVHAGNIQAGIPGIAGAYVSYPPSLASGNLSLQAINNSSNSSVTIVNDTGSGTNTVATLPFSGFSAYKLLVSDYSGEQFVQHGDFSIARGNLSVYGGNSLKCLSPTTNLGGVFITGTNSSGNFAATITNNSLSRNITYHLPDSGVSSSLFILSDSAGTQIIATGSLAVTHGNVQVGSNGVNGQFISYPPTGGRGTLSFFCSNNNGNYAVEVTNNVIFQNSQFILEDPGPVGVASFITSQTAEADQVIFRGGLTLDDGDFVAGNNIGNAGKFVSNPSVANSGVLQLVATPCTGTGVGTSNATINITNSVDFGMVGSGIYNYIIPTSETSDSGDNSFLVIGINDLPPETGGHFVIFEGGEPGLCGDPGVAVGGNIVSDGVGVTASVIYSASNINPSSVVAANLYSSANPATILSISPGVGTLTVTYSSPPGATVLSYVSFSGIYAALPRNFDHEAARISYLETQQKFYKELREKQKNTVWYRKIVKKLFTTIVNKV